MESIMELDELKTAWQSLDRRLQQQNALNFQLLRSHRVDAMRRGLRPLTRFSSALQRIDPEHLPAALPPVLFPAILILVGTLVGAMCGMIPALLTT